MKWMTTMVKLTRNLIKLFILLDVDTEQSIFNHQKDIREMDDNSG